MKKTFSLVVDGATYHIISYYNPADVISGTLRTPSSIPQIASLPIGAEFTADESQFRQPPAAPRAGSFSRSNSESNNSDTPTGQAGPSSDRYVVSPVHSPTLSPTPPQWTSTYTNQSEDSRYSYQSPDGRLHENLYGQAPTYPSYTPNIHHYDQSTSRSHASGHDQRDHYELPPLMWPHTQSHHSEKSPSRAAYEHASDSEASQSRSSRHIVLSSQPTAPTGPYGANCL